MAELDLTASFIVTFSNMTMWLLSADLTLTLGLSVGLGFGGGGLTRSLALCWVTCWLMCEGMFSRLDYSDLRMGITVEWILLTSALISAITLL